MSACGSCQMQQIVRWSIWRQNCPSSLVTVSSYPLQIPSGTAVPAWAYLNVTYLDRFDAAAAQSVLTEPDVTSDLSSTPTSSSSSDPTTTPASTTSNTTTPSASETSPVPDSPSGKNNIPAIVGGTVGGVVGLGLIACLVLYLMKRDSRKVPASAEFSKVIPPGSPVPASFDPAVVGFRSHTTSPVNHGLLNNAGGPYVIPNQPHQHQNSVPVAPYAAPWSPPPATYTPAPNAGYYSNIHTPNINQQLNYTPLPGHTGSPPPMQQYSHSHSASMGHTPSPYQGMPPYGPGASGNPSFATGTPEI
ncbi:hypothetical protein FRC16_004787 [Serendipita sp. 398]|nr:hypothetical protein FRC16_004787 [Serendipita sp. 398]